MDDTDVTRRRLLLYGGGVVLAAAVPAGLRPRPALAQGSSVPSFASLYGRELGSSQASVGELDDFVQKLAAASDRVRTELLPGRSHLGRPLRLALVSSPQNLARLDDIERRTRALRLKPPSATVRAREVAALPALVNVLANVHGNEPSGADGAAQVLYELAAGPADDPRLTELVVAFVLVQNPDGREASRRVNANGFDLNRDWFAFTQPETPGKLALYSRRPPVLGIDMHEQFFSAPDTFFFPPDNDPVHHESSRAGLRASNEVFTPAMEQAFKAKDFSYEHYGPYDVFYPGYGDIAPNQAWGAAGVLLEMENANVYPEKVVRQATALDAALRAAAGARERLLGAWAAQWPEAAAQGARGELLPNLVQGPDVAGAPARVPDERVYGYAFRTSRHAADVAHLVDRLRTFDCQVHVTTRPVTLRLRAFGERSFVRTSLGRGTVVVSAAQPMKHWVHILLADDPFPSTNAFYDVSGWSNPALMALAGGAIGEPIAGLLKRPRRRRSASGKLVGRRAARATLKAVDAAADLQGGSLPAAGSYAFALDASLAQAAAFALVADGVAVRRSTGAVGGLPAGAAVVDGGAAAALRAAAKRFGIRPTPLRTQPAGLVDVRRPRCLVLHDVGGDASEVLFATSNGFATWLLRDRFGLPVERVTPADLETGALDRADVLVVPDGLSTVIPGTYVPGGSPNLSASLPGGGLSPLALAALQAWVRRGGTFLGWRSLGVAVATAAGIAGDLQTVTPPSGFVVPGLPVRIALAGEDRMVRGLGDEAYAFTVADPILRGGGSPVARYPSGAAFRALGYASGLSALEGTVAATVVELGAGRSYVLSFDPAYRGFVEGAQRMVGNVLLEAAPLPAAARAASAAARVQLPEVVGAVVAAGRPQLVRVTPRDAAALRRAVAATEGIPAEAALTVLPDGALEFCAPDPDPLSGHTSPWVGRLTAALRAQGAAPELVVA